MPARRPAARERRLPDWLAGALAVLAIAAGTLLAFTKELPFAGGYELKAVFSQVQGLTAGSPVRIAGVEVGEVTEVEPLAASGAGEASGATASAPGAPPGEGAAAERPGLVVVTMEIDERGRPIGADATLRLRPRLFLEGNYFLDLRPGTPAAAEAADGHTIPLTNTSVPVQLDQVLSTLESGVRADLQATLRELGDALARHGGARGLRTLARASAHGYEWGARVNQALLGTEPHDLSELVGNLQRVVSALGRDEGALQGLVGNLNALAGALARQAGALERSLAELPSTIEAAGPALAALNASLPAARAFAREALPGVEALPPSLDAGIPLLDEASGLLSRRELGGVLAELRPTVPRLGRLARGTIPFLGEARALSSCFNEVVIPWSHLTVPDPETPATGSIFEETSYGLVGISGESRSADANGPYARVLVGTGSNFVVFPPFDGTGDEVVGVTPLPILGARPSLESSAKTPFRRDVACEANEPPDLDSGQAAPPPEQGSLAGPEAPIALGAGRQGLVDSAAARLERAERLAGSGERAGRARRLVRGALADLERALAGALGWESLLGVGP